MQLPFDHASTRKLELWAIANGISLDVERETKDIAKDISVLVMARVVAELDKLKPTPTQPEKGAVGA